MFCEIIHIISTNNVCFLYFAVEIDALKNYKNEMRIEQHNVNNTIVAEVISDSIIIHSIEDGLNLLGDLYYQGFDKMIVHEENITPDFFDLKTGIAGEILQKFSNYRVRLAIAGYFAKYTGRSINDFIYESNKGRQVVFVSSVTKGLSILSR